MTSANEELVRLLGTWTPGTVATFEMTSGIVQRFCIGADRMVYGDYGPVPIETFVQTISQLVSVIGPDAQSEVCRAEMRSLLAVTSEMRAWVALLIGTHGPEVSVSVGSIVDQLSRLEATMGTQKVGR